MTRPTWRDILLKGARTFPEVPWAATSRWRAKPSTFLILNLGLVTFGIGDGLIILSKFGNSPWAVFHQGLSQQLGISYGNAAVLTSFAILLFWIPLKEKPGLGTIANAIVIGYSTQVTLWLLGDFEESFAVRVLFLVTGLLIVGLGIALYITTNLGPGPRDGIMTALHYRTGVRVARVRLSIELSAMFVGWLLGGTVGVGSVIFALVIGRAMALWLGILARVTHTP